MIDLLPEMFLFHRMRQLDAGSAAAAAPIESAA